MADQNMLTTIATSPRWTIMAKMRNVKAELQDYQVESIIRHELGARFAKVATNGFFEVHVPDFQVDGESQWVLMTLDETVQNGENVKIRSLEDCCFLIGEFKVEYSPKNAKAPYPINFRLTTKKGNVVTVTAAPEIKLSEDQYSLLDEAGIKFATQFQPMGYLNQGRYERFERSYGGLIPNSLNNLE